MGTTNIPLVTLPVGTRTFGPHTAAAGDSSVTLTIDRTPAGGLNALTAASTLAMEAQLSTDGGATWHAVDAGQPGSVTAWTAVGGLITGNNHFTGQPYTINASSGTWPLYPGASRRLQAIVTVSGPSPIAVAGSIATS